MKHILQASGDAGGALEIRGEQLPPALLFWDMADQSAQMVVYVRWK